MEPKETTFLGLLIRISLYKSLSQGRLVGVKVHPKLQGHLGGGRRYRQAGLPGSATGRTRCIAQHPPQSGFQVKGFMQGPIIGRTSDPSLLQPLPQKFGPGALLQYR